MHLHHQGRGCWGVLGLLTRKFSCMCVPAVAGLETIQEQGPNSGLVQAFQQLSECQQRHCVHQLLTHCGSTSLAAVSSEEL